MLSTSIFFVLFSIVYGQSGSITDESCKALVYDSSNPCSSSVVVSRSCTSATLDLGETRFKTCTEVYLFWAYPMNNLTITVVTPFTKERHPCAINIQNVIIKDYDVGMYRILDGQEIDIKTTDDIIVQKSDSNYQIVLKFKAQPTISYYGFPLNYKVTKS
jgi:hypothetical protein